LLTVMNLSLKFLRFTNSCHGIKLEWCSISVTTISSPSTKFLSPHPLATKFIASVVPPVNITCPSCPPINFRSFSLDFSYSSVAISDIP